jgi:hypothetical protein
MRRRSSPLSLALLAGAAFAAPSCGGGKPRDAAAPGTDDDAPLRCEVDQTREYVCDNLLPLASAKPAPEPYQNCPGTVDVRQSVFEPLSTIARFDPAYTELTRKRVPPGHSCCYAWCTRIALGRSDEVDSAICSDPNAMQESYCMVEPEAGVSESAGSPYDRCPAVIRPPAAVAFSAPKAALFDATRTGQKRQQGQNECCYGWCSKAPPGTGLRTQSPNAK